MQIKWFVGFSCTIFIMAKNCRNSLKAQQWKKGFDKFEYINIVEY